MRAVPERVQHMSALLLNAGTVLVVLIALSLYSLLLLAVCCPKAYENGRREEAARRQLSRVEPKRVVAPSGALPARLDPVPSQRRSAS